MHHPEDFLLFMSRSIASLRCPYAGLVSKFFFNGVFDHQIPEEHPVSMVDIFVINVHTTGNQFFVGTHINDLDFFPSL